MVSVGVESLRAAYGRTEVLRGVDLTLEPGRSVALLGPSGCGKTTLLRAIAGFVAPSAGCVRIDGFDLTQAPPNRRGVAMVFQSYALWPHMSVAQNIAYGLKLRGVGAKARARKVSDILSLLRLDGLEDRPVTALSGGQRQRVALGRALAVEPRVLLLDEPLSNLDARVRFELRHELRAVQDELGVTTLCVTHDKEDAMVLGDEIAIVLEGRIGQIGPPADVYERPASLWIADFLGATNRLEVELTDLSGPAVVGRDMALPPCEEWTRAVVAGQPGPGPRAVCFRPGEVSVADADAPRARGAGPAFDVSVVDAVYVGGAYRHRVRCQDRLILADLPKPHSAGTALRLRLHAPGDRVFPIAPLQDSQQEGTEP